MYSTIARQINSRLAVTAISILFAGIGIAGEVDVIDASAEALDGNTFRISATLRHADEGWSHYADSWQVHDSDGELLGTRKLAHPHVDEQPFTRSLTLEIPEGISAVTIIATDSVHESGGEVFELDLPGR